VWLLTIISALCSLSLHAEPVDTDIASSRVLRAGFLGLAILTAAVASQYASDRRFAIAIAPGQLLTSALTLLLQIGSAAVGLVSVLMVFARSERVSYVWFFAGVAGLFSLLGVAALGLRRP
jgi:hypothetical protein